MGALTNKILFVPGDKVYFINELHTVLFIVPPGRSPQRFEKEIDAAYKEYTPLMNEKQKLHYQQNGNSLFRMTVTDEITYIIASEPLKSNMTIYIRKAYNSQLESKEVYEAD